MALAPFNKFNVFPANLANGVYDFAADTFKLMLTNVAPTAANAVYADITEIANGNGYTTGGASATLVSSTQSGGLYKYIASFANPTWTATGTMATFRYAVLYDVTPTSPLKPLVGWWDYGSAQSLTAAQSFVAQADATNGILQAA